MADNTQDWLQRYREWERLNPGGRGGAGLEGTGYYGWIDPVTGYEYGHNRTQGSSDELSDVIESFTRYTNTNQGANKMGPGEMTGQFDANGQYLGDTAIKSANGGLDLVAMGIISALTMGAGAGLGMGGAFAGVGEGAAAAGGMGATGGLTAAEMSALTAEAGAYSAGLGGMTAADAAAAAAGSTMGGAGSGLLGGELTAAEMAALTEEAAAYSAGLGNTAAAETMAGGTLGGGAGSAYEGGLNALNGSDIMSDQFVANGGHGAGGFGGTSGGYFDNLLNGAGSLSSRVMGGSDAASTAATTAASTAANAGANSGLLGKALGVGATLLGGAAGAQGGQGGDSTTSKDVPEWFKPYVTKNLDYASGLLDRQMAPGYLQGYDDMRSVGQGLLNQPIAGNGFSRFFPGRG